MTPAQLTALKAFILGGTDAAVTAAATARNDGEVARLLNLPSAIYVWKTTVPASEIFDAISWANLTPTDPADGTLLWQNRAMVCQGKQNSLMLLLQGQDQISSGKSLIRAGLNDALSNLPSGASGTVLGGGWLTVKAAMYRLATVAEALFAVGAGTTAAPSDLVVDEQIGMSTVSDMLNS